MLSDHLACLRMKPHLIEAELRKEQKTPPGVLYPGLPDVRLIPWTLQLHELLTLLFCCHQVVNFLLKSKEL